MSLLAAYLVALALGGMAFFSFVAAPVAFARLSQADAGTYIRGMFRVYYPLMGTLTALAALFLWRFWPSLILTVVAALFFWLLLDVMPRINRLRDAELAGDVGARVEFERLHRESVIVNFAQLVALVVVFWGLAGA
jgi:hypothetical protein